MEAILGNLPQFLAIVEKLSVAGLLVIALAVLGWDYLRVRKDLVKVYGQREKARLGFVKCKAACDANNIRVDLSDLTDLLDEGEKT